MKKILVVLLICSIACFVAACGNTPEKGDAGNGNSQSQSKNNLEILKNGEWPNNEYTQDLLTPEAGTVSESWIDLDKEFLYISLSDIGEEDAQRYVKNLKANGFSLVEDNSEEINSENYISNATVLMKDNTVLSMAYINEQLAIYIKK